MRCRSMFGNGYGTSARDATEMDERSTGMKTDTRMALFYPLESRIFSLVTIRQERLLPRRGEILVRTGDAVAAMDVIGRARVRSRWHCLDLASMLGVTPEAVEAYLMKQPGDTVEKGEIIASRKGGAGLFRRVCKSPAAGVIAAVHAGRMLIEEQSEEVEVRALLRGRVVGIMAGYGAIIETKGALIKAAASIGKSTYGVVKVLSAEPKEPLQVHQIDIGCHGAVAVAGWCADGDALKHVEHMQARGVILGGLDASLCQMAYQLSIPIVITEGYGHIPMNRAAFDLLSRHNGSEIALICPDGEQENAKPEIIIPLATEETTAPPLPPSYLQVGQTVRVIRYPYLGHIGRVVALSPLPRRLESGGMYEGVEVELETGETVFLPWMNVEPVA